MKQKGGLGFQMYHVTNGLLQLALLLGTTESFPTWARLEMSAFSNSILFGCIN